MAQSGDRETVREFFRRRSFFERWMPVAQELIWALGVRGKSTEHQKLLPDYCYNIFAVYRRTYFKGLPTLNETVSVRDQKRLAESKSIEEAKQILKINWRSMGKIIGVWSRGVRFFDLEAEQMLKSDGLLNLSPKKEKGVDEIIFGKKLSRELKAFVNSQKFRKSFKKVTKKDINQLRNEIAKVSPMWTRLAYQWSPEAMSEFNAGMAEGQLSFLDKNGQLAGESNRANIYGFLLMAWPEIKEMLESSPKKTMSDLHIWMQPFMREDLTAFIDIETLRDVCARPPSGVGLSLRPLKVRRQKSSA